MAALGRVIARKRQRSPSPEGKFLQSLERGMQGPDWERDCGTHALVDWGPPGAEPSSQVACGIWGSPRSPSCAHAAMSRAGTAGPLQWSCAPCLPAPSHLLGKRTRAGRAVPGGVWALLSPLLWGDLVSPGRTDTEQHLQSKGRQVSAMP